MMHTCMRAGVFVLAVVCAGGAARADWVETVSGTPGAFGDELDLGLNPSWQFAGQEVDRDITTVGLTVSFPSGEMRLQSNSVATGGLFAAFGSMTTEVFTDVTVTAEVSSTSNNFYGVGLRSSGTNSYLFLINPSEGNFNAEIVKAGAGIPGNAQELADTNEIADFASYGGNFYLEFTALGTLLIGRVYDAPGGTLLASVFHYDAVDPFLSGYSGVLASFNEDVGVEAAEGIDAYFDNITSSTAVPTPSALASMIALGGIAFARRRRR